MDAPEEKQESERGQGNSPLTDPHHQRDSLRVIQQAVSKGWNIPQEWMDKLPAIAAKIATDPGSNARDRLRAMEVLKGMSKDKVEAAIALDKIERLDGGQATEITNVFNVKMPGVEDAI